MNKRSYILAYIFQFQIPFLTFLAVIFFLSLLFSSISRNLGQVQQVHGHEGAQEEQIVSMNHIMNGKFVNFSFRKVPEHAHTRFIDF